MEFIRRFRNWFRVFVIWGIEYKLANRRRIRSAKTALASMEHQQLVHQTISELEKHRYLGVDDSIMRTGALADKYFENGKLSEAISIYSTLEHFLKEGFEANSWNDKYFSIKTSVWISLADLYLKLRKSEVGFPFLQKVEKRLGDLQFPEEKRAYRRIWAKHCGLYALYLFENENFDGAISACRAFSCEVDSWFGSKKTAEKLSFIFDIKITEAATLLQQGGYTVSKTAIWSLNSSVGKGSPDRVLRGVIGLNMNAAVLLAQDGHFDDSHEMMMLALRKSEALDSSFRQNAEMKVILLSNAASIASNINLEESYEYAKASVNQAEANAECFQTSHLDRSIARRAFSNSCFLLSEISHGDAKEKYLNEAAQSLASAGSLIHEFEQEDVKEEECITECLQIFSGMFRSLEDLQDSENAKSILDSAQHLFSENVEKLYSNSDAVDAMITLWLNATYYSARRGDLPSSRKMFHNAIHLANQSGLRNTPNFTGTKLKLFANFLENDTISAKDLIELGDLSPEVIQEVELLPSPTILPWSAMYSDHRRFHLKLLKHCINHRDHSRILSVLSGLQARELLSRIEDSVLSTQEQAEPSSILKISMLRRELHELREKIYCAGVAHSLDSISNDSPSSKLSLKILGNKYQKLFREMKQLRGHFSEKKQNSIFGSTKLPVDALLRDVLHDDEYISIFFVSDDNLYCLSLSKISEPHLKLVLESFSSYDSGFEVMSDDSRQMGVRSCFLDKAIDRSVMNGPTADETETYKTNFLEREIKNWVTSLEAEHPNLKKMIVCQVGSAQRIAITSANLNEAVRISRTPSVAHLIYSRLNLATNKDVSTDLMKGEVRVGFLCDEVSADIPSARLEVAQAKNLWMANHNRAQIVQVSLGELKGLEYLHVSAHGVLISNKQGQVHNAILAGDQSISEAEIYRNGAPKYALLNVCVGGSLSDDPLSGDPNGLVSAFLLQGSDAIIAASIPISDLWASLFGLLVVEQLSVSTHSFSDAFYDARTKFICGNWGTGTTKYFTKISPDLLKHPRKISKYEAQSPQDAVCELFSASKLDVKRLAGFLEELRKTDEQFWWVQSPKTLATDLVNKPAQLKAVCENHVADAVKAISVSGVPLTTRSHTIIAGVELFQL